MVEECLFLLLILFEVDVVEEIYFMLVLLNLDLNEIDVKIIVVNNFEERILNEIEVKIVVVYEDRNEVVISDIIFFFFGKEYYLFMFYSFEDRDDVNIIC